MADPITATKLCASGAATVGISACPSIPGWVAPTVVVAILGLVATIIFQLINNLRATAKDRRTADLAVALERYKDDISTPVRMALSKLEEANTSFHILLRYRDTPEKLDERASAADAFQKDTVDPAKAAVGQALQRADRSRAPITCRNWQDFEDQLDDLSGYLDEIQKKDVLSAARFDVISRNFSARINEFCQSVRSELSLKERTITEGYQLKRFGMMYSCQDNNN